MRFAANVAIMVFATLVVAAVAYGGMASQLRRTVPIAQAMLRPEPSHRPAPTPEAPVSPSPSGRQVVWDADIVDESAAWLLLSDCSSDSASSCHYSVERTDNAGAKWSTPVLVGPLFASADEDAPRTIRFLDRHNGFVYGHRSAFVTHDGGRSWADSGFGGGEVVNIALFENTVWAVTRPCAKGVACAYEVRSSQDAGRTWSLAHQLPAGFSPDSLVAFGTGAILSTVPPGGIMLTADHGVTWQEIESPCTASQFRGNATTADGVEIWALCQGSPDAFGAINDASIFVSSDARRTWSRRGVPGILPEWLVCARAKSALVDGKGPIMLTNDSGLTWSAVTPGGGPFAFARFLSAERGWAMDSAREAWLTLDGGASWFEVATLPSTQP